MGRRLTEDESRKLDAMDETRAKLHDQWAKYWIQDEATQKRVGPHAESKGCELPSGDNLRPGDVVHLRAKFVRPAEFAPRTHGVFDIGGLVQFSPFAEIVDVELPSLAIGDRVVTPKGERGTVVDFFDDGRLALIDLGVDGWGEMIRPIFVRVDTLTRRD